MPFRLKANGKPGESEATLTLFGKMLITITGLSLATAIGQGFIVWRDVAVLQDRQATMMMALKEHQDKQDAATAAMVFERLTSTERLTKIETRLAIIEEKAEEARKAADIVRTKCCSR